MKAIEYNDNVSIINNNWPTEGNIYTFDFADNRCLTFANIYWYTWADSYLSLYNLNTNVSTVSKVGSNTTELAKTNFVLYSDKADNTFSNATITFTFESSTPKWGLTGFTADDVTYDNRTMALLFLYARNFDGCFPVCDKVIIKYRVVSDTWDFLNTLHNELTSVTDQTTSGSDELTIEVGNGRVLKIRTEGVTGSGSGSSGGGGCGSTDESKYIVLTAITNEYHDVTADNNIIYCFPNRDDDNFSENYGSFAIHSIGGTSFTFGFPSWIAMIIGAIYYIDTQPGSSNTLWDQLLKSDTSTQHACIWDTSSNSIRIYKTGFSQYIALALQEIIIHPVNRETTQISRYAPVLYNGGESIKIKNNVQSTVTFSVGDETAASPISPAGTLNYSVPIEQNESNELAVKNIPMNGTTNNYTWVNNNTFTYKSSFRPWVFGCTD